MNDLDRDLAKRFARPVMRNAFRAELRNKLMREAQTILSPRPARSPLLWLRPALAAGAVTLAVITVAGTVAASSLAGDPLFGVKRATEEVAFTFTFDDVARVQLLSDLTDRRLAELSEATRERPAAAPTATPRTNETSRPAITPRPIDSDRPETPRPPTSSPRR